MEFEQMFVFQNYNGVFKYRRHKGSLQKQKLTKKANATQVPVYLSDRLQKYFAWTGGESGGLTSVSYTHLTLPTILLV